MEQRRESKKRDRSVTTRKRMKGSGTEDHKFNLEEQMEGADKASIRKRNPKNRTLQSSEEYVNATTSNKILVEARRQQREIQNERDEETGLAKARQAFSAVADRSGTIADIDSEEDEEFSDPEEPPADIEEISEEEERIMSMFMASDSGPKQTLADLIMQRIQEKDAGIPRDEAGEERKIPGLDAKATEVFAGVGKLLSRYTAGKLPKAFKIIPSLSNWEEYLYIMEPEKWTPNAMYQATRMFASNLNSRMARRFYKLVLLPHVREDINEHKRLHFASYQALKKAVFKPSAFYTGILLPLCQSRTCNLREAVIIGSIMEKMSIPVLHSSVALLKIAEMEYCGTNSYFMKLLLNKKYALPYRVLDAMVAHFEKFIDDERDLPVIWHQCLLTFVQRYKNELSGEDKEKLRRVMSKHKHYLVTDEIHRELNRSLNRGQKHGPIDAVMTPKSVIEDFRDLPEVQFDMDED